MIIDLHIRKLQRGAFHPPPPPALPDYEKPGLFRVKGELQRRNKLISSERLFKILQNETKMIKVRQVGLKIFNFKDREWNSFPKKSDRKPKMLFFRGFAQTERQWIVWRQEW